MEGHWRSGLPFRLLKKLNKRNKSNSRTLLSTLFQLFPLIPHPAGLKDTYSLALSATKFREFLTPCLLSDPDNTALRTASLQIPSSEGMATIQLGPMKKLDCAGQRNYRDRPRYREAARLDIVRILFIGKKSCPKERKRLSPSAPY